jgi:hypothetical protein
MLPTQSRIEDLQARFNVTNGRIKEPNRYKNLNWYLRRGNVSRQEPGEWFCYGDVDEVDIVALGQKLANGEIITMGWKDLPANVWHDPVFSDGEEIRLVISNKGLVYDHSKGIRLVISNKGIIYDHRRDGKVSG